jgi:hypothetical protein
MNDFDLKLAVLSAAAYRRGRSESNRIDPAGVAEVLPESMIDDRSILNGGTGFEARAYRVDGRIVIAFAGTETAQVEDIRADVLLAVGKIEGQLKKAAEFYTQIKQRYGSDIVFTGHSLGGGLAALMAGFFDKPAVTFDPAPFRLAATTANADKLAAHLKTVFGPAHVDPDLSTYHQVYEQTALIFSPRVGPALTLLAAGLAPIPAVGRAVSPQLAQFLMSTAYPTVTRNSERITA